MVRQQRTRRCSGTLYATLGVSRKATQADIKKAYHLKALEHHPDKAPGHEEQFKAIQEAHAVLMNPDQRELYDRLGGKGMKDFSQVPGASSVVAIHPAFVVLYPLVWLVTVVCVIAFLALLAERVDTGISHGTWAGTVFVPLWILAALLAIIGIRILMLLPEALKQRDGDSENKWRPIQAAVAIVITNLVIALLIATTASVARALDGGMSWRQAFIPVFILLALSVVATLASMDFNTFIRSYAFETGVEPEEVDRSSVRGRYIATCVAQVINIVCQISFVALLYRDAVAPTSNDSVSYFVVVAPVLVRIGLPVLVGLFAVVTASGSSCLRKVFASLSLLIISGLTVLTILLITWRCENGRLHKSRDAYPTLGTAFIPVFVALSGSCLGALFMSCAAIGHAKEQLSDATVESEEEEEDAEGGSPRREDGGEAPSPPRPGRTSHGYGSTEACDSLLPQTPTDSSPASPEAQYSSPASTRTRGTTSLHGIDGDDDDDGQGVEMVQSTNATAAGGYSRLES